jgi:N utilization substance protein B
MINRTLIRIKVLQIVYAYYQQDSPTLQDAEKELMRSLQKSYDLYFSLLQLIGVLTDIEQKRLDNRKHKFLQTETDAHPNTRLIDNRFAEQLRINTTLEKFTNKNGIVWNDDDLISIRQILDNIVESDLYQQYIVSPDTYESDQTFWRKVLKQFVLENPETIEMIEEKDIYWTDDLDIIGTFVVKTIKQFTPETGKEQELLPMFKDEEDRQFAVQLFKNTIFEEASNTELIDQQIKNWELERIASMDLYIMQMALAEIRNFPGIPTSVTLNEYIDLARYYSTPKSGTFVNGVLDSIVNDLKNNGKIFKN